MDWGFISKVEVNRCNSDLRGGEIMLKLKKVGGHHAENEFISCINLKICPTFWEFPPFMLTK